VKNTACYEREKEKRENCTTSSLICPKLLKGGPFVLESKFQANLIKKLKALFPDCIVMKNDPTYIQGIPDLLVIHGDKWASLECKKCANARHQPNQDYYVAKMDEMSFCRFIYPENEEQVLTELKHRFKND
jgi:hypothetical protein